MAIAVVAVLGALVPAASAATFTNPVKLTGAAGGEPSIVTDPFGDAFVSGPQGIPSGANETAGVGFWVSRNDGSSFATAKLIGSDTGGGDSDLLFSKGALYVADLEASTAQICKSTDRGNTFSGIGPAPDPNHCTTTNGGQAGPSEDREWLTASPSGTLYLTYHEFVSAQPLAFRSDNAGGDNFSNTCGSIVTDPTIESNVPTDITGGTLVAKPVTDSKGNLYVLFSTTTQHENALAAAQGMPSGTFSQLYLAVSHDKCQSFTDYTVFDGEKQNGENTVQFGDIFNDLAIDGADNLYVVGAGYIGHTPFAKTANVYMFRSTDHGTHWSVPTQVGASNAAHMLPAAAGGPRAGQLTIGYFRTVNGVTDPNSTAGKWTYSTAQSTQANSSAPAFSYSEVNPGFVYHKGDVCNEGILCGSTPNGPSDRSLLDFTSVATDTHGCPIFTFAGNPTGSPGNNTSSNTFNYVSRQTSNCFITSSSTGGGSGSGGKGSGGKGSGGKGSGGSGGSNGSNGSGGSRRCPRPTGRIAGRRLGPLALGMTRARARHILPRFKRTHNDFDNFCLRAGWGIRVGYPSAKLLRRLPARARRQNKGRIVIALTANRHYALDGVRPGARLARVARRLRVQRPAFHIGRNHWYIVPGRAAVGVLKVRRNRVQEVGIATKALTRGRTAQRRLLRSFNDVL
ncbi:MAG TPA: hypothetical protein VGL51_16030 [Solirubrobacteraceae bacterium]|jgi:hypothetical protein